MKRKVLSILLSLCMVLTMVPTAFAVEDSSPKDIYVANDGDDNYEGNESAPVKTLGKALEGIRWRYHPSALGHLHNKYRRKRFSQHFKGCESLQ